MKGQADVPDVVADIAPVQSLVAMVMDGVGVPDVVVKLGASPHHAALRPSDARKLQNADLVVWMGPELTPWLEDAVAQLAVNAVDMRLLENDDSRILTLRSDEDFELASPDHEAEDTHHDEDDDHATHDEDAHAHDHVHEEGAIDPHAWLDPENARIWIAHVAETLSQLDPDNAARYAENASTADDLLAEIIQQVEDDLEPVRGARFVVAHDAFQYFEVAFDIQARGAITLGDDASPGAARVQELRTIMKTEDVSCLFVEPLMNTSLAETVIEQTGVTLGQLDSAGVNQTMGMNFYPNMILSLKENLLNCLR